MSKVIRVVTIIVALILVTACTRMPTEFRDQTGSPVVASSLVSEKMSVVGSAMVGKPTPYLDRVTGLGGEIVVESEYFSANGRLCRRYTEKQASHAAAYSKLACHSGQGWVEIPVDTFAG